MTRTMPQSTRAPVSFARDESAQRRLIVKWVWFLYFLMLIEGPLRKWFLPGLATPLIFLRDPFVLALYGYALIHGRLRADMTMKVVLCFGFVSSVATFLPLVVAGHSPIIWGLGMRTYWIYAPLAVVVAQNFDGRDLRNFVVLTVVAGILHAPLVAFQAMSSPFDPINWGVAGDDEAAVDLADGIVRPFGVFTYTGINVIFTAFTAGCFFGYLFIAEKGWQRPVLLVLGAIGIGVISVLTGSRAIYFFLAASIFTAVAGNLVARPTVRTLVNSLSVIAVVVLGGAIFVLAFPSVVSALMTRIEIASVYEGSIANRAFSVFAFYDEIEEAPLLGHGVGIGAPGVAAYARLPALVYGEGDHDRAINELGPILGLTFILLRVGLAVFLVWLALQAAERGLRLALPVAGFVAVQLAANQMTDSPLKGFFAWLAVGIVLACWHVTRQRAGPAPRQEMRR